MSEKYFKDRPMCHLSPQLCYTPTHVSWIALNQQLSECDSGHGLTEIPQNRFTVISKYCAHGPDIKQMRQTTGMSHYIILIVLREK